MFPYMPRVLSKRRGFLRIQLRRHPASQYMYIDMVGKAKIRYLSEFLGHTTNSVESTEHSDVATGVSPLQHLQSTSKKVPHFEANI